jgi:AAHS family 4-hydroxybenzoate transporter-like MFS transporter
MKLDVDRLIDEAPIAALQYRVFIFCAVVALLDAVDSVSIGLAGPLIATDLKMTAAAFSPVYSSGLLGAAIGALIVGPISDRYGRKPLLVLTTAVFGLFTCLTVLADSFPQLIVYRFIAGLGLGGATPCFITMAAEYAPQRSRATIVSLLWAGYPFGNSVGGFLASYLLRHFHWSMVFYAGGVPTLIVALLILLFMPESLRFLAAQGASEKAALLVRALEVKLPSGDIEIASNAQAKKKVPIGDLFVEGRAPKTILLGLILYFGFATTTVIVLQTPTLFRQAGVPLATSAFLVGMYSIVATFGMAIAGYLLQRFGAMRALVGPFAGGAVLVAGLGFVAGLPIAAGAVMALLGLTVSLGTSGAIAWTAASYPTAMRSAAAGWVMFLGRLGQVCSPLVIGLMLALAWPPGRILAVMAAAPLFAAFCTLLNSKLAGRAKVAPLARESEEFA